MAEALANLRALLSPYDFEAVRFRVTEPEPGRLSWELLCRKPARGLWTARGWRRMMAGTTRHD